MTRTSVLQSRKWWACTKSHLSSNNRRPGTKKLPSPRFISWWVLILTTKIKSKSFRIVDFMESNLPSIRQYQNSMKEQKKLTFAMLRRSLSSRTYLKVRWTRPGSMLLKNTFWNRLMTQQAIYCQSPVKTRWKVWEEDPRLPADLLSAWWQIPGLKGLGPSAIEHHHRFNELLSVAELIPAGDIAMPNKSLALEWFYITFHKSERDQFITSGWRLVDEKIKSITEYFKSLYNIKRAMAN